MTFSSPTFCPSKPLPKWLWSGPESHLFDLHLQTDLGIPAGHLMENAGQSLAHLIRGLLPRNESQILHLVGPGNNGGDALVAARQLHQITGLHQTIWAPLGLPDQANSPAQLAAQGLAKLDIPVFLGPPPANLDQTSLIVDGLFGVGLARDIAGKAAEALQRLAALPCPSLAIDIASGLHADHGSLLGTALPAQWTLCMIGPKQGCYRGIGPQISGQIYQADIGVSAEYAQHWLLSQRAAD